MNIEEKGLKKYDKIIGRDITLLDYMIAIEKKDLKDEYGDRVFFMLNANGMIQCDLNKPLQSQSDETLTFLADLILNK